MIITERLKSESPNFFKKLRKYALIGTIILSGAIAVASGVAAPAWVLIVLGALDSICVSTIGNSMLTTKNIELSKK